MKERSSEPLVEIRVRKIKLDPLGSQEVHLRFRRDGNVWVSEGKDATIRASEDFCSVTVEYCDGRHEVHTGSSPIDDATLPALCGIRVER